MQDLNQENKALREELSRLKAEMEAIGAGGVESLRRTQCLYQISEPESSNNLAIKLAEMPDMHAASMVCVDEQIGNGASVDLAVNHYAAPITLLHTSPSCIMHSQAKAAVDAPVAAQESIVAGALFDFCGYLTTLPKESAITASEVHEAAPMADALKTWADKRDLHIADADVPGWRAALSAQAAPVAVGEREDMQDMVSKALTTAWQLGQTFWRQADSVRHTQHVKSEQTERDFEALIENTRAALAATPGAAPSLTAPPLTPDEARQAARFARLMNGPSDVTQPYEYAMAGALALAAKIAATPAAASSGYQCADCKAPLRAGYTCDKCGSSAAEEAEAAAPAAIYKDSTPQLHIGDSSFEGWYAGYVKHGHVSLKQHCRDAYAAGMGDPLVVAAPAASEQDAAIADMTPVWLQVDAEVRYWEDAEVNGEPDDHGDLIPLKQEDRWVPVIRLADGFIGGWPAGTTADIHYKVCDQGEYFLLNAALQRVAKYSSDYVPSMLAVGDNGYGDYIILKVAADGFIAGWTAPSIDSEMWPDIAAQAANGGDKQ